MARTMLGSMRRDALERLAVSQPAQLLTNAVLARHGIDRFACARLVSAGDLFRLLPGVHRLGGSAPHPEERLVAPLLYLRTTPQRAPSAVVSGADVLRLIGIDVAIPRTPLLLTGADRKVRLSAAPFVARRARLDGFSSVRIGSVWCAEPVRALADWVHMADPDPDELRHVVQDLRNVERLTAAELVGRLPDGRHPGCRPLRALIDSGEIVFDSDAELRLMREVFERFPPPPDVQVQVGRFRVDMMYVFPGVVLEYFGEAHHAGRVDADACRTMYLRRLGLDVIVVTKGVLADPRGLAAHVHDVRRRREADVLAGRLSLAPIGRQPPRLLPLRTTRPLG